MELAGGPRPATRGTILLVTGYDGAIIPQTLRGAHVCKSRSFAPANQCGGIGRHGWRVKDLHPGLFLGIRQERLSRRELNDIGLWRDTWTSLGLRHPPGAAHRPTRVRRWAGSRDTASSNTSSGSSVRLGEAVHCRGFEQTSSFEQNILAEKERLEAQAVLLAAGPAKDTLLKKINQSPRSTGS
ncbi:hypothetical protein [Bradyrhizobium sp. TM233]|uniref:hypothetical protein n=1 Tax=Bradyrhizobium sp. TM233 TaxID=2599801 RepID=UPI0030C6CBFC